MYVAGRPNWEYKFLHRAVEEDAEINLVGLLRIAKKQPKFSFRDRSGVGTNPLFAGLGEKEEEAVEQYDEPVIVRLGVENEEELSKGFPRTAEELFRYQAIIIDDLESDFFTADQQLLLRRFVNFRGGGMLLLGGQESFNATTDAEKILGELAPVYLKADATDGPHDPYFMSLTREGWLQPWLRLRTTQNQEEQRLQEMASFESVNHAGNAKPGASVLATGRDAEGREVPLIVSQRFGLGRTMALLAGDLWRWGLHRQEDAPADLPQAWRQVIRYLVSDVPQRVELKVFEELAGDRPTRLEMIVRDEAYQPIEGYTLKLEVFPPSGESFTLTPEADESKGGVYHAECWPRETGGYRAELVVQQPDGTEVGRAEVGWAAQPGVAEFQALTTNRELLQTLASETGGQVIDQNELAKFVADWPHDKVPVREAWVYPLWHQPWVIALVIGCLCGEWGLRRWKGLP